MAAPVAPQALNATQASRLQQAVALLQRGDASAALASARQLAAEAPDAPDARQLLAVCLDARGDLDSAASEFQAALALAPGHAAIRGNYARLLRKLGVAFRDGNDFEAAERALGKATELDPGSAPGWFQRGFVLRRLGRADEAIASYDRARAAGLAGPELEDAVSGALLDIGETSRSLAQARAVVARFPDFVPGYTSLAHLLLEYGSTPEDDPIAMFAAAVQARPRDASLRLAYAGFLLSTRQPEPALAQLRELAESNPAPVLTALEADAWAMLGDQEGASRCYARAHAELGGDPDFLNAYARHLLRVGEWDAAARQAEAATRIDPANQQAWAYLGTAWRLLGDAREFWLFDYERLIGLVDVEPPAGYADSAGFLRALQASLEPLHQARREPAQQSLRGGSQTPGRLFGRRDPVIEATRAALARAVEHRIASLPDDPGHPFLARKRRHIRFSGSWSVRLWSSGNHVNHIHQEGWMSSAFYVSLPPSVRTQADGRYDGCIQFGQPPVELGLDLPPRLRLRPEPGKLALFPSYMWHGTVPFEDVDARLTIAFDMIPSQDPT